MTMNNNPDENASRQRELARFHGIHPRLSHKPIRAGEARGPPTASPLSERRRRSSSAGARAVPRKPDEMEHAQHNEGPGEHEFQDGDAVDGRTGSR